MRLTGDEVEAAIAAVAGDQLPGEVLDYAAVAEPLSERLEANLVGRAPGRAPGQSPEFAGKHQRQSAPAQ